MNVNFINRNSRKRKKSSRGWCIIFRFDCKWLVRNKTKVYWTFLILNVFGWCFLNNLLGKISYFDYGLSGEDQLLSFNFFMDIFVESEMQKLDSI